MNDINLCSYYSRSHAGAWERENKYFVIPASRNDD